MLMKNSQSWRHVEPVLTNRCATLISRARPVPKGFARGTVGGMVLAESLHVPDQALNCWRLGFSSGQASLVAIHSSMSFSAHATT